MSLIERPEFDPLDPFPADFPNALQEFIGAMSANFTVRVKPGDATLLQIPASTNNGRVAVGIEGRWRWIETNIERVNIGGSARTLDVYVTAAESVYTAGDPGETDSTDRSFALSIQEVAAVPTGVDVKRLVAKAIWNGTAFTAVDMLTGPGMATARHAATHAVGGSDPLAPADIGAATTASVTAAVAAEATARAADVDAEEAARIAGDANNPSAGQKAALAGTSGAPGSGNKYVTDADARNTNARTPTAHAASHRVGGSDETDHSVLSAAGVLEVGMAGQHRAGRVLTLADFTAAGLPTTPVLLANLATLSGAGSNLGSGGNLSNKGGAGNAKDILGTAGQAAQFAGLTSMALYLADTGGSDPFRIKTGSLGCWFCTAKRGTIQTLVSKWRSAGSQFGFNLRVSGSSTIEALVSADGSTFVNIAGATDVCDDRWHFVSATADGSTLRIYLDGALEASVAASGAIFGGTAPLNVGAETADGSTAAINPHCGRIDEAFVTPDVASEDQVRFLMCASLPHGYAVAPKRFAMNVIRKRKGANWVTGDFTATPKHRYDGGSTVDGGSLANNLTVNNGPVTVAGPDGAPNGAYIFKAASSQYLSATDAGLPTSGPRSIAAWFKTASSTGGGAFNILTYGSLTAGQGISLGLSSTNAIAFGDSTSTLFGPVVNDGAWHLVVVTQDSSAADGLKWKMYLDGRLVDALTASVGTISLAGANGLRIGRDRGASTGYYDGALGAFAITDYAMDVVEILGLRAKGSQAMLPAPYPAADLIEGIDATNVYWLGDDLESQWLVDSLSVAA